MIYDLKQRAYNLNISACILHFSCSFSQHVRSKLPMVTAKD